MGQLGNLSLLQGAGLVLEPVHSCRRSKQLLLQQSQLCQIQCCYWPSAEKYGRSGAVFVAAAVSNNFRYTVTAQAAEIYGSAALCLKQQTRVPLSCCVEKPCNLLLPQVQTAATCYRVFSRSSSNLIGCCFSQRAAEPQLVDCFALEPSTDGRFCLTCLASCQQQPSICSRQLMLPALLVEDNDTITP